MAASATSRPEATLASKKIAAPARPSLFADYAILFKPRVSLMVLITAAGGFYLGTLGHNFQALLVNERQQL